MSAAVDQPLDLLRTAERRERREPGHQAEIDRQFLDTPFYGVRQMAWHLRAKGWPVNVKRVRRLMRKMGLMPIYQRPKTSTPAPGHKIYPYLLRGLVIDRPNQVWCSDLTYIPLARGFLYLCLLYTSPSPRDA